MTDQEYAVIGKLVTYRNEKAELEAELKDLTQKMQIVLSSAVGTYNSTAALQTLKTSYDVKCSRLATVNAQIEILDPAPVADPIAEENPGDTGGGGE